MAARWSLKKARLPVRHSEFDSGGANCPAGMGREIGRHVAAAVGSPDGVMAGGRPTSDKRVSAPQPASSPSCHTLWKANSAPVSCSEAMRFSLGRGPHASGERRKEEP